MNVLRRMKPILIACLFAGASCAHGRDALLMVGPMVHYNFGGASGSGWSFALEASYWSGFTALDWGVEIDLRKQVRIYGEAEAGFGLAGLAAGPMIQFGRGGFRAGLQGSVWANYFAGADFRLRKAFGIPLEIAPGAYLKVPADAFKGGTASDRGWDFDD